MARVSKYRIENSISFAARSSWRAGYYLRLSREDGDRPESESIGSQRLILDDFIGKHPEIDVADVYADDGFTGTNFNRPEFQRLLEDIRGGRINCVIVKDLSRFGRNYVETGQYLEVFFPMMKVRFIAVNDNVDSVENPSSMNTVMVPFKNIMNDEYCRDISLKVRSSLTAKRKQGQFIGSFAAYGYKKDPANKNKLLVDDEAAETVRLIYELFLGGRSVNGIAKYLNEAGVPNPSEYKKSQGLNYRSAAGGGQTKLWAHWSVRRILTNRLYTGDMVQRRTEYISYKVRVMQRVPENERIIVEGTHEAIVPREIFDKAQSLLGRDTRTSPLEKNLSLFAGFVKCADCGRAMQRKRIKQSYKEYEYYVCSTYRKMSKGACSRHTVNAAVLEKTVLTVIQKYIEIAVEMDEVIEEIKKSPARNTAAERVEKAIAVLEREAVKCKTLLVELYPDFKSGLLGKEQYISLKEKYENRLAETESALLTQRAELTAERSGGKGANAFLESFIKHRNIDRLTRPLLIELVNNIYVHEDGGLTLDFRFRDAYEQAREYIGANKELAGKMEEIAQEIEAADKVAN